MPEDLEITDVPALAKSLHDASEIEHSFGPQQYGGVFIKKYTRFKNGCEEISLFTVEEQKKLLLQNVFFGAKPTHTFT